MFVEQQMPGLWLWVLALKGTVTVDRQAGDSVALAASAHPSLSN